MSLNAVLVKSEIKEEVRNADVRSMVDAVRVKAEPGGAVAKKKPGRKPMKAKPVRTVDKLARVNDLPVRVKAELGVALPKKRGRPPKNRVVVQPAMQFAVQTALQPVVQPVEVKAVPKKPPAPKKAPEKKKSVKPPQVRKEPEATQTKTPTPTPTVILTPVPTETEIESANKKEEMAKLRKETKDKAVAYQKCYAKPNWAKRLVWRGTKTKTSTGLRKRDLTVNSRGKIVSKKVSAEYKRLYRRNNLDLWTKAAKEIREEKGFTGFVMQKKDGTKAQRQMYEEIRDRWLDAIATRMVGAVAGKPDIVDRIKRLTKQEREM